MSTRTPNYHKSPREYSNQLPVDLRTAKQVSGWSILLAFLLLFLASNYASAALVYIDQPMTWEDADAYAQANFPNGHLVSINSQRENDEVESLINQFGSSAWIGYHDSVDEGQWQWTNGDSTGYENWREGEPNDHRTGEDYAEISLDGQWNDLNENRTKAFVVEYIPFGVSYYQAYRNVGDIDSLSEFDFDNALPFRAAHALAIDTSVVNEADNYILRFSGEFYSNGEAITFRLNSDDGSNLYIGGEIVIFNDGLHSPRIIETTLNLPVGFHSFRLDYHEKTGGATLDLQYKTESMSSFAALGAIIQPGEDRDNDSLNDGVDRLFASGCNLSNLPNDLVTDYRNCNFDNQDFPDGTYRNKVFDGSSFSSTDLSNVTFIDSSFIGADLRQQNSRNNGEGVEYSGNVTFINANFTQASVEKHWPNARFYNVNFGSAFFDTSDSDNYDSSWYCFQDSQFLNTDLIRYSIPSPGSEQSYRLGVPGLSEYQWDISSFWEHGCVNSIPRVSAASISELANSKIDIAPAILMNSLLGQPYDAYANYELHDYPISGDDTRPSYRNETAETTPYWEWDMGNYYQMDSIRIYKNPNQVSELDNAVVLISDWPFAESPLIQSDFDSTVRYQLNPTAKAYYEIPINRTLRYIRIQRPINGTNQFLSFKKISMFGNSTPLNQTSTPQPANFALPLFESNRPECEDSMFAQARIDDNFDYIEAAVPDAQGRTYWNNADLSRQIKNNANFYWSELNNTNFEQTELVGADFRNVEASGANFRGANLAGADFTGAKIRGADFRGANLTGAKFGDVYADCAYFSGALPESYYSGVQSHENPEFPMISALSGNSAYGYARSSSIDLGGTPSMAIDGDTNTSSITAIEQTPWWELDMGAIYVLSNISLDTDHDLSTVEKLKLFVSDWPLPADFDGQAIDGQVVQITDFEVDSNDNSNIKFNTEQTGRFIHVRASVDLGQLRLRLAEVTATTPVIPSAPSSSLPLTDLQANNLVPNTQNLLNSIDNLIDHFQKHDANDGIVSAQESLNKLTVEAISAVQNSDKFIEIQQNFRKITRPVDSSVFLVNRLKVIPPLKTTADNFSDLMKPVQTVFKVMNLSTHAAQQSAKALNREMLSTVAKVSESSQEISSQVSILKTGRSYIETLQRCAIYGTDAASVRADLEAFSLQSSTLINNIANEISVDKTVEAATANKLVLLESLNTVYSSEEVDSIHQTSGEVLEFMGPFATAITPMQLIFAEGEIYDGFTIWDIVDFLADATDFFLGLPGISDTIEFVDGLLSPVLEPILSVASDVVDEVILGPFGDKIEQDRQALIYIGEQLVTLKTEIIGEESYPIPSVDTAIFADVMDLSGDSKFASCRDSLNLPPQWPTPDNDDDGDGLTNSFEVGYAPDNITAVTNTLTDNPDSDLDGLSDYFEWYWSTQAGSSTPFDPTNGSLNEALRDDDGDGLTAIDEQALKTNPYLADTDGDGINDGDELEWGTNPLSAAGDFSDLELDLDEDELVISQEMAYQLNPIDPLDILLDHDEDGVSTKQEILQQTAHTIAAPVQIQQSEILINDRLQLSQELNIDLNEWVNYSGEDLIVIDEVTSQISEGQLIIDNTNLLTIKYKLDDVNLESRHAAILIRINTNGGNLVIRIELNIQFPDDDNDGINNYLDNCSSVYNPEQANNDADNIGDACDNDDDNDGVLDTEDAFPLDANESVDTDNDGIGNNADTDDDGDGVLDENDAFPLDESESKDSDGDGVGDNSDPTPYPPSGELNFDSNEYFVDENASSITITVNRTNGDYSELSVDYSLQDGSAVATSDYEYQSNTLTFADGEISKTVTIIIVDDFVYESNENFTITLSNLIGEGSLGSVSTSLITIQEDDAVPPAGEITFEFDSEMVNENDGSLSININRNSGSFGELKVSVSTTDGSAVTDSDYTMVSDTLTFLDGETSKMISIELINDDIYESDETFSIHLSNLIGDGALGTSRTTITILDDEPMPESGVLEIESSTYSVDENGAFVSVNIIRTGGDFGDVSVDVSTSDSTAVAGVDFESFAQTLTFTDGESLKTITLNIFDDLIYEGDEILNLNLTNVVGASLGNQSTSTITIIEDDEVPSAGVIQLSGENYSTGENQGNIIITVTRANGSFGDVSVDLVVSTVDGTATADEDYLSFTETLVFLDSETSQSVSITILDDLDYEGDENFNVVLSNIVGDAALGNPANASVTIIEDEAVPDSGFLQLSGENYSVNENQGSITLTVQRIDGSYGDVSVDYVMSDGSATDGSDYSSVADTLFFDDGVMSQTITVDIIDDTNVESKESFVVALQNPINATLGAIQSATVIIEDDDESVDDDSTSNNRGGGGAVAIVWLLLILFARRRIF